MKAELIDLKPEVITRRITGKPRFRPAPSAPSRPSRDEERIADHPISKTRLVNINKGRI